MANDELAQAYADRGLDVYERGNALVIDVPNPRITDDDYFHGENPHTVGFGSRGITVEARGAGNAVDGRSTADVQQAEGGLGWNEHANQVTAPSGDVPDESTRNADIEAYAETHRIDLGGATTKADMLDVIRAHHADQGGASTDED